MCQQLFIGDKLLLFKVYDWSFILQGWVELCNFKTIFPWEKETPTIIKALEMPQFMASILKIYEI